MPRKIFIFALVLCLLSNAAWASIIQSDSHVSAEAEEDSGSDSNGALSKHCRSVCSEGQACSISILKQKGQKPRLVTTCTAICGDGIVAGTQLEQGACDDGNEILNDGCSNCMIQPLYWCEGSPSICSYTCGNQGYEPQSGQGCDDGNNINGDGCSSTCTEEPGWICENINGQDTKCSKCGDGVIQADMGEECDFGDYEDPGCIGCKVQDLFDCSTGTGSFFRTTNHCKYTCGVNGLQTQFGEFCDDGNNINEDGCSAICTKEEGYVCVGGEGEISNCFAYDASNTLGGDASNTLGGDQTFIQDTDFDPNLINFLP